MVNSDIFVYSQHGRDYDFYIIPALNLRGQGSSKIMTVKFAGGGGYIQKVRHFALQFNIGKARQYALRFGILKSKHFALRNRTTIMLIIYR